MANTQVGPINIRIAAKNQTDGNPAGTSPFATPANYASISAMRTRLAAINAGLYTTSMLDAMTVNDMVYAIRLNDDAGTI